MRYVIVDLDGASRGHFDSREDTRNALREIEADYPEATQDLYVVVYGDDDAIIAGKSLRGDELLASRDLVWIEDQTAVATTAVMSTTTRALSELKRPVTRWVVAGVQAAAGARR